MNIGVLHPGAMGVTLGAALKASGHQVGWVARGRSADSVARAADAGLDAFDDLPALLADADGVISVCPPDAARAVAESVHEAGFSGVYVDANAIAPATARSLQSLLGEGFVDGGIIGPPAHSSGTTRLYLSGAQADATAGWFNDGVLGVRALDGPAGAASALKMCYAAYTKGTSALLLAVRALAEAEGVTPALLDEWDISQPGLGARSDASARATAPKAWRFIGEMEEIAASFDAQQLPAGFHLAAAEVYRAMGDFKTSGDVELAAVLAALLDRG